jgi:hypothetical protein
MPTLDAPRASPLGEVDAHECRAPVRSRVVTTAAAIATCVLLGALAVFQALLACRAPLGRFAWGGQHEVLPTRLRVGSVAAIVAYVAIGWAVLARAGQLGGGHGILRVAIWVIAGYFLLGAAGNLASRSRSERLVMAPLSVVLCALTVVVAAQG